MNFTTEQDSVIRAENRKILVSAAAGSGKTAVLVERIFRLVSSPSGIDADRLLVVTFTRAAAAEMKERIRKRIAQALSGDPGNTRLQRQEALLHHAQITTIDAFCHTIVRENFSGLDIDPAARIADDGERRLLEQETLADTMERLYEAGDADFLFSCDYFSAGASDVRIGEYIAALHRVAGGMPDPDGWLRGIAAEDGDGFEASACVTFCKGDTLLTLESCAARLSHALDLCGKPDGPYPYADALEGAYDAVRDAVAAGQGGDFDTLRQAVLGIAFPKLKPVRKNDAVSPALKDAVTEIRDGVKKAVADLQLRYFRRNAQDAMTQEKAVLRVIRALAGATLSYEADLRAAKREKNLIDFNDIEHLALSVLARSVRDESGNVAYEPTQTALEYRDRYAEVMIDEYQDSSLLQELILSAVSEKHFMVGDVKQSIYRFRQARPKLFTEKMGSYRTDADAENRRIDLHKNFRSRPQVLDTVNAVFTRLMGKDLGGVMYDADAQLVPGTLEMRAARDVPGYGSEADPFSAEVLLCEAPDDRDETEAYAVAKRIARLVREEKPDGTRVRYGDIVILMRSTGGRDEIFRRALEAEGIPVYMESRTGYYNVREIRSVLQLLSVLNNPLQDIPFASVMRGAFGGFDDAEIARIRAWDIGNDRAGGYFSEITERFAAAEHEAQGDRALCEKVKRHLDMLARFRAQAVYLPVHTLLETVFDETGFADIATAMPGGARRRANLEVLLARAKAFEKTSYRGLSRFISYIEALQKYEADEGEANVLNENADVVRIMTIHKSKGLEFPVVFVAGLSKQFNLQDARGDLLIDAELGVAGAHIDVERRTKASTLRKNAVARKLVLETLGEELRVLYVGMTRASDKLILSGTLKNPERELAKPLTAGEAPDGLLSYASRTGALHYLQWVLYALSSHPRYLRLLSENGIDAYTEAATGEIAPVTFTLLRGEDLIAEEQMTESSLAARKSRLLRDTDAQEAVDALLEERFSFRYPHEAYRNLFTKTTVTELKEAMLAEAETGEDGTALPRARALFSRPVSDAGALPAFMREDASQDAPVLDGASRGTLYHKAMELIWRSASSGEDIPALAADADRITAFLLRAEADGLLAANGARAVDVRDVGAFLKTPLAERMTKAAQRGMLHTERQFMIGIPAREMDETLPAEEVLLVQGIIDVWFEEDDALVILDYKTDRVREAGALAERYRTQLDYYARALTQITGMRVKERIIYSFALGCAIVL